MSGISGGGESDAPFKLGLSPEKLRIGLEKSTPWPIVQGARASRSRGRTTGSSRARPDAPRRARRSASTAVRLVSPSALRARMPGRIGGLSAHHLPFGRCTGLGLHAAAAFMATCGLGRPGARAGAGRSRWLGPIYSKVAGDGWRYAKSAHYTLRPPHYVCSNGVRRGVTGACGPKTGRRTRKPHVERARAGVLPTPQQQGSIWLVVF